MPQQVAQPSAFDSAFAELKAALVDLNGDGQPDIQIPQSMVPKNVNALSPGFDMLPAQQPMNALMGGGQQPSPSGQQYVDFPIGANGETERRPMNALASPASAPSPASARNPVEWGRGVIQDVTDDPISALQGADAFMGLAGPLSAAHTASNSGTRQLLRRDLRGYTEAGARQNSLDDAAMGAWRDAERTQQRTDLKDWAGLPAHTLQPRSTKGRFGKLPDDVKALRDKGRTVRDTETRAAKKYPGGKLPDHDF